MPSDPFAVLELVHDEESFLRFLNALAEDRADEAAKDRQNPSSPYGPGANGWENVTIESFLSAAVRWAREGNQSHSGNTWRRCAEILYAGKIYE